METNSKLALAHHVVHRDTPSTIEFVQKLSNATAGEFQLSTDAFPAYRDAAIYGEIGERPLRAIHQDLRIGERG